MVCITNIMSFEIFMVIVIEIDKLLCLTTANSIEFTDYYFCKFNILLQFEHLTFEFNSIFEMFYYQIELLKEHYYLNHLKYWLECMHFCHSVNIIHISSIELECNYECESHHLLMMMLPSTNLFNRYNI